MLHRGAILKTSNSGVTWTVERVPPGIAFIWGASCSSSRTCVAITAGPGINGAAGAVRTEDGGRTWQTARLAEKGAALSVSCGDGRHCVAVGSDLTTGNGVGRIRTTANAGASWLARRAPKGTARLFGVSCATANRCAAVGMIRDGAVITTLDGGVTWLIRRAAS